MSEYVGIIGNNYTPNTTTQTETKTKTDASSSILSNNFDTFVNILTAQLKSQDPLDPMDATSFTDQLVQFSGVEQSIKTNQQLEKMTALMQSNTSNSVSYLGKSATIDTSSTVLSNGNAQWNFQVDQDAKATIEIRDSRNQVVRSADVYLLSGEQDYTWDGLDNNNAVSPDGVYTLSINARDANNNKVDVSTTTTGKITALDMTTHDHKVTINGKSVSLDSIKRLEI